ncbi:MAG: 30S ribosomal protein S7 [Nanobdellota archaeon]
MTEIKFFNKWGTDNVTISDQGLKNYVVFEPKSVPKTGAKYAGNRFHKSKTTIVERFINKMMVPGHKTKKHFKTSGHITGKAQTNLRILEEALNIVEEKTKENPIAVLVSAVENSAPREEVIAIEYGGARYPKAVECAPQRRVDLVLRWMTQGAYQKSFNSSTSIEKTIADEIINAYNLSPQSTAISKKNDLERQADSSR